ncbi:LexA family transcriptional regulator [Deinococcus grandis]|nr:S24 family peptidase [Deinococcus grandis]
MLVETRMGGHNVARGPQPKNPVPNWALALRMRRVQLGNLTQEDVQERSKDLISQGTVSDLERGKITLDSLNVRRASALAQALGWSLIEMQRATGVDLGLTEAHEIKAAEPTPVYSLKALGSVTPVSDGVNITPNPGPHPANWMQTFMDGDEMDPRIRDGETIYLDTDKTTPDKGVYVIRYRDRAYVRRFSQLPTGPAWTADNPAFAHQFIPDGPEVTVLGKIYRVVGIRDSKALN